MTISIPSHPHRMLVAATWWSAGLLACGLALALASLPANAQAACVESNQNGCTELSGSPPQDTTAIPPNIVLILDDSGSMAWTYMPDKSFLNTTTNYRVNSANNRVYYDPTVVYEPPPKADGTRYAQHTDITAVTREGFSGGSNANLTNYTNWATYGTSVNGKRYFRFATGLPLSSQTMYYVAPSGTSCDWSIASWCVGDDHVASGPGDPYVPFAKNIAGAPLTVGENVANWFAYYHTRILMAKSGLMTAFADLSPNYRFGFGAINNRNTGNLPTGRYTGAAMTISNVRPFGDGASGTTKAQFWRWLETMSPSGGTPLRRALQSAGKYYETDQPWETMVGDPNYSAGNTDMLSCRASYTILTTDGFWNGSAPSGVTGATDTNGPSYTNQDGNVVSYQAIPPFSGGTAASTASLADVAADYWKRDLRNDIDNLVPTNSADPAFWQHMTTFTFGIGFEPVEEKNGAVLPMDDIFAWARDGGGTSSPLAIPGFAWPTPKSDQVENIADMAHAAVVGHGDFFSATNPQELADGFAKAIAQISDRNVSSPPSTSNTAVAVMGALTYNSGYNTSNWSGSLKAYELNQDGSLGASAIWDVDGKLKARAESSRDIYTSVYQNVDCSGTAPIGGTFDKGIAFAAGAALDCWQQAGLESPALAGGDDTLNNRISYLRGDASNEGAVYRTRLDGAGDHWKLGAIIRSSPTYVAAPSGDYRNIWPSGAPEGAAGAPSYSDFRNSSTRTGTIYVGANDGMLHAFSSPAPNCDYTVTPPSCSFSGSGGEELWAYVPRAVYTNLGNLTAKDFTFRPTVDAIAIARDVFYGNQWRTLLVGGVGLGGRGIYALDITDPSSFNAANVLWEFDSDMKIGATCKSNSGACDARDLGYTLPQPNVGRLANGKWVVVASNGYFPDCSQPVVPTGESETSPKTACKAIAADAPQDAGGNPYSALFVIDAQSGQVLAELKTPTNIGGVRSYGLGPAVLGDYDSDQIADVAFAGDLLGNVWRFDLSSSNPSDWDVTLAYRGVVDAGGNQGVQPITVMPRLFPDLRGSRFMVVFGTGKYLGPGDNDLGIPVQSVYGFVEPDFTQPSPAPITRSNLTQQKLTEVAGTGALAGATLRKLSDNPLAAGDKGWYIDLDVTPGERVVETPATIVALNSAIVRSMIPSNQNYCDPSLSGALMTVNAANGGSDGGLSSLGGNYLVGARVAQASTGGTVPVVQRLGGGSAIVPVQIENGAGGAAIGVLEHDLPLWRQRSWSILKSGQ